VNARDAIDRGGVLRMETANVELDAEYAGRHLGAQPGAYVMLAVSDSGAGMTQEVKQRLFEPFFTTKGLGKGTGLGLSIVYGIVKQNQGEIVVYSEAGRGTTFKIYFPQVEGIDDDPSQDQDVRQATGTETILLCEDEEVVRKLVSTMLSRSGYRVLAAAGPDEAIRITDTHPGAIDLMLTDVVMPEMNGPELYGLLRERRPELKVLYMSGYTDNAVVEQAALTGSGNFLQKPFTRDGLIAKLQSALTSQR